MNFDRDYLKKRLQNGADNLIKDLADSYFNNDKYSEFDDIVMADVLYSIVEDVTANDEATECLYGWVKEEQRYPCYPIS